MANLWKVHLAVKEEGYVQNLTLGMFRSDYMLDASAECTSPSLKQVEFNTISSSFGGLADLVTALHTELATFPTPKRPLAYPPHALFNNGNTKGKLKSLSPNPTETPNLRTTGIPPPNRAVESLAAGLAAAHAAYGRSKHQPPLPLCILFLVQDGERNVFDQLALSEHLQRRHGIPCFRLPALQILTATSIPAWSQSRPLLYHPYTTATAIINLTDAGLATTTTTTQATHVYEATTVYLRALYSPTEYDSASSWAARLHLERSAAIKCPTVLLHLAGSKKVQQVLTSKPPGPDHLARFLPQYHQRHQQQQKQQQQQQQHDDNHDNHDDTHLSSESSSSPPSVIDELRTTFAPQYSLSTTEGLSLALNPTTAIHHVLKPQREGGGNNVYRDNIPKFLESIIPKSGSIVVSTTDTETTETNTTEKMTAAERATDAGTEPTETTTETTNPTQNAEKNSNTNTNHDYYKQYILMELIQPPPQAKNSVLRSDGTVVIGGDVISELGVFGTCLWRRSPMRSQQRSGGGTQEQQQEHQQQEQQGGKDGEGGEDGSGEIGGIEILHNEGGQGYLLRTKARESDEGGVAAGFSSLDSLILYDDDGDDDDADV